MKLTPEIEAVARAICTTRRTYVPRTLNYDDLAEMQKYQVHVLAVAAIRALRKLSFEASLAGGLVIAERLANDKAPSAVEVHAAMIDAALGENK